MYTNTSNPSVEVALQWVVAPWKRWGKRCWARLRAGRGWGREGGRQDGEGREGNVEERLQGNNEWLDLKAVWG